MGLARSAVSVVFIGLVWMGAAPATAAPQQLMNKTVTLSWTAQAVVRDPNGKERQTRNDIKYIIYISSLGRLFEYSSRSIGRRTQGGDVDPNAAKTGIGEARGLRFEGNQLVAYRGYAGGGGSGAMRAVATFDSSYSSCTVAVVVGKENGKTIKRQGFDGVVREVLSVETLGATCSIQNGNAFANR
ncbi:hypothetical protein [Bradyrhizobium sp. DASA03120]|uniref:hypothetical protein n=1 Tax=Bradyrhizobium sp. SMVTL-02 TaxID=3395917 RepID=UPI003F6F84B2